jgi:hypothetical protein
MGLRQVAQTLTAKRPGKDVAFYGRVSVLDWNSRPEIVNHIYRFWAEPSSGVEDGEIFYYGDIDRYFIVVSRTPIYIKSRLRYISGVAVIANEQCEIQTLETGTPDAFGASTHTWTIKLTTYCNILSGILDTDQLSFNQLEDSFYSLMISRTTEPIYKVKVGDRIVIGSLKYRVEIIDESRYTSNVYTCRVKEDLRS